MALSTAQSAELLARCTQVKGEVEAGIDYLLQRRKQDPYRNFVARVAYETSWGGRQAPSFDP